MFVTRCAREAAGARGPASVCPVGHSNVAKSVSSSVTSMMGKKFSFAIVGGAVLNQ